MSDVFVRVPKAHRQYVLLSGAAYHDVTPDTGARYMVLEDGWRYAGLPGDALFSVTRFEPARGPGRGAAEGHPRGRAQDARHDGVDRCRRARPPGGAPAPDFGPRSPSSCSECSRCRSHAPSPRQGRYGKLFLAIVVYFIYTNAISIAENLVERGMVPALVGAWPVHAAMALAVLALLLNQTPGGRRLGMKLRSARPLGGPGASP